jgi:hypothetical protein
MKKRIGSWRWFIGVVALTMICTSQAPRRAFTQQQLELPAQSQPSSPPPRLPSHPAPQNELQIPVQRQPLENKPSVPIMPEGRPQELTLPSTFRGCWDLVNDQQLGPVRLMPEASTGCAYTQDSGRFCYERTAGGSFEPTFSSFRIKEGAFRPQKDEWSKLLVLSTDGLSSAKLRLSLHHVDSAGGLFQLFGSSDEVIDEMHDFDCRIAGDHMLCIDIESGSMYGRPWCDATHRDDFVKSYN